MYSFNGVVTLPDDTPMTASQLIQAALEDRAFDTAQQKADMKSRFYNALLGELIIVPSSDIFTGDAYRRVTNGVCDSDFDGGDLTDVIQGNAVKVINPCASSNRAFYQNSGSDVDISFDASITVQSI